MSTGSCAISTPVKKKRPQQLQLDLAGQYLNPKQQTLRQNLTNLNNTNLFKTNQS